MAMHVSGIGLLGLDDTQEKGKERFVKEGRTTEQNPPRPHYGEPSPQILILHSCSMEHVSELLKTSQTR